MMKKIMPLALVASLALPLAACDWWGTGKKADASLNDTAHANASEIDNATLGNGADGSDEADNATLVDQAGPETNAVAGNTL